MTSLLERFIPESRDYLESAAAGLLKLERDPSDEALINEVFRAVHTLKGASGLFDIPGLTRLVHAGEDLLGAVRANQLSLDSVMVDLLLDSLDRVSVWVDELERRGCLPHDAEGISAELSRRLWALLPAGERDESVATTASADLPPDWLAEIAEQDLLILASQAAAGGTSLLALSYDPDDACFYRAEDPFNLLAQLDGLKWLRCIAKETPSPLAEADPFRNILSFRALVAQPRSEVEQLFRYVIDQISLAPVSLAQSNLQATHPPSVENHSMVLNLLSEQRRIVALPIDERNGAARLAAVGATLDTLCASSGLSPPEDLSLAIAEAGTGSAARLLAQIAWIESALAAEPLAPDPVAFVGRASDIPPPAAEARQIARVLKVDQAKVDALMTLIAELVVSKNSLPFLAKRAEDFYGSRDMSREIKDQYAVIDRLAQEMQRAIMDVRLLPVSEVFERFPRLVRDLSRKLDKQIDLRMLGEDTAADKTIVEALGDPLIHLVRNAIDHGIEQPEQRVAAGKPETATIQLEAFQEGDQVIIQVSDDGKGIDPLMIKAKAVEKGLITAPAAEALSDQDAVNLVFLPGFSTAKEISDLSGRGVGMDVVRTAIEKVNGRVTLSSRKGEGTAIRLSLPLSMAVSRVMMVEIGDSLFGVPMDGVVETVKVARDRIRRLKRAEAFVLRDAIVPMVRMRTLLQMPAPVEAASADGPDEEAVLVARVAGNLVGLVVDRFREGIDVILKPMDGVLAGMRGYSGSALLGDGRVLLVLNLKELL